MRILNYLHHLQASYQMRLGRHQAAAEQASSTASIHLVLAME